MTTDLLGAPPLASADLNAATALATADLRSWRGARVLVTGATGFVGTWTLSVLAHANRHLDLNLDLVALARRPHRLASELAEVVTCVASDVRTPAPLGHLDAVLHLACPSSAAPGSPDAEPKNLASTIVNGTRAILRLAPRARVLVASSGAVHGRGYGRSQKVDEDFETTLAHADPAATYGISKLRAEADAVRATEAGEADAVIARLWAFIGPLLPTDAHFAAGNFIADAVAGRPIAVKGDPATVRSYLYPVDLVVWLLAVLTRGRTAAAYNVGSDVETTIGELAMTVARISGSTAGIDLIGETATTDHYVPDTARIRKELHVNQTVFLDDAIERTLRWHRTAAAFMGDR